MFREFSLLGVDSQGVKSNGLLKNGFQFDSVEMKLRCWHETKISLQMVPYIAITFVNEWTKEKLLKML